MIIRSLSQDTTKYFFIVLRGSNALKKNCLQLKRFNRVNHNTCTDETDQMVQTLDLQLANSIEKIQYL